MDSINYKDLYHLQNQVLDVVFETENEFYLTGGTCLSRFYMEKRFSDDLDFFTNASGRYNYAVKKIKNALKESFNVYVEVETKDFNRFRINGLLQIDFINDISVRYKDVIILENGYIIDNIENILSNKITAILGRDNPKDIFDICLISKFYSPSWSEVLEAAHKKASFSNDELLVRLKSFPMEMLKNIKMTEKDFLKDITIELPKIIERLEI